MDDVESKAELVYRYVTAKRRTMGRDMLDPDAWEGLRRQIRKGGPLLFFSMFIDPVNPQVIVGDETDEQAHKFFRAIIGGDDAAISMDLAELGKWRNYVLKNGPYPPYSEC